MGGRGSESGLSFSIPSGGHNFTNYSLGEQLPKTSKEALGRKGKQRSIATALKTVNPNRNPAYSEYSENCQRCVVAYELQRRGYNVEAQPTYDGDKWSTSHKVGNMYMDRWRGAFRHAKSVAVGSPSGEKVLKNIAAEMKSYGPGARAVVSINYKGRGHGGHVFNVENVGGRVQYVDAQTGNRYNQASMRNLFKITNNKDTTLTRTDNLRISERSKEFVWQRDRNKRK